MHTTESRPAQAIAFVSLACALTVEPALAHLCSDWRRGEVGWQTGHEVGVRQAELSAGGQTGVGHPGARLLRARTLQGDLSFEVQETPDDGQRYTLQGGALTVLSSADQTEIVLTGQAPPAALMVAFNAAQCAAGLVPLHAAVLTRGGQTLAIGGPSGAGKSTVALRLLARGWSLLAEDSAWYHPSRREVVGWDSRPELRLWPESLNRFAPELAAVGATPLERDAHGKLLLPQSALDVALPLTRLLLLGGPLSRLDTVASVWSMTGVPLTRPAQAAQQLGITQLLQGTEVCGIDRDELVKQYG